LLTFEAAPFFCVYPVHSLRNRNYNLEALIFIGVCLCLNRSTFPSGYFRFSRVPTRKLKDFSIILTSCLLQEPEYCRVRTIRIYWLQRRSRI